MDRVKVDVSSKIEACAFLLQNSCTHIRTLLGDSKRLCKICHVYYYFLSGNINCEIVGTFRFTRTAPYESDEAGVAVANER